ncbi:hypothetical protein BC830DRAFT_97399 [Chytriomyces sp. MP71]|nr:hypothetical protein BC830DRAFT_97399 [Chytriomyces sp. MP71]
MTPLQYTFLMTDQIMASLRTSGFVKTDIGQQIADGVTLAGKKITDVENELITPGTKILNCPQTFANRYYLDFSANDVPYFAEYGSLKNIYNANNVMIVSNGNCGSTCAQFTTIARDQVGIKAVTYGGGNRRSIAGSKAFDPTSFAAGFIIEFQAIASAINRNSKRDDAADAKLSPGSFPKFAVMMNSSIAFATSFSPQGKYPDTPIEWVISPSDFYLDGAEIKLSDAASIWDAIVGHPNIFGPNSTATVVAPTKKSSVTNLRDAIYFFVLPSMLFFF